MNEGVELQHPERGEASSNEIADTTLKPPAAPSFVKAKDRFRTIDLTWPLEYDGKVYDRVTVRRMTGIDLIAFVEQPRDSAAPTLPMFDVPQAVIDALDPDDAELVNKAVQDFLPRALRPVV